MGLFNIFNRGQKITDPEIEKISNEKDCEKYIKKAVKESKQDSNFEPQNKTDYSYQKSE